MIFLVIIAIFITGITSFLIFSSLKMEKKRADMTQRINELKAEIRSIEEQNSLLQSNISETKSDEYWEEKAREQGYEKEGETTVVVVPPEDQEEEAQEEEKSFWGRLIEKIGF